MYKGYKVTKHLQRYMRYAKDKYEKMSLQDEIDLWDILEDYDFIMQQAKCIQMYIYDWIQGEIVDEDQYKIISGRDGCIYVRETLDKISY